MNLRQMSQISPIKSLVLGLLFAIAPALALAGEDEIDPTEIEAPEHWEHELRIYHERQEDLRSIREDREDERCHQYDGDISDLCEDRAEEKYDG